MHQIKNKQIHKEIRARGKLIRTFLPYMKESTFKKANTFMTFMKGKGIKGLSYKQVYIERNKDIGIEEKLRLCVYQPIEQREDTFGLLWIHGGGYNLGLPEQEGPLIKELISTFHCTIVSPDYTLAVKQPFPAALLDCYSALIWMKEHAKELHIKDDQLFVGGESAGGGLTAALCIYARDKKEINIAFQLPLYPMLDDRMKTKSSQNNDAPIWNSKSNEEGWKLYLREAYQQEDVKPYAVPGRLVNFSFLPPAYTFVGDIEPFYDETILYMENLKKAGIEATYDVYPGCYHGFDIINPKSKVAKESHRKMIEHIQYAATHYFKKQNENK